MKNFAWRALHGCIPCHVILANKHITNAVNCPMCQTEADDIKHALFTCSRAKGVWTSLGIGEHIQRMMIVDRSGFVLILEIIRNGGELKELNSYETRHGVICLSFSYFEIHFILNCTNDLRWKNNVLVDNFFIRNHLVSSLYLKF